MSAARIVGVLGALVLLVGSQMPVAEVPLFGQFTYFEAGDALSEIRDVERGLRDFWRDVVGDGNGETRLTDLDRSVLIYYLAGVSFPVLALLGFLAAWVRPPLVGFLGLVALALLAFMMVWMQLEDVTLVWWGPVIQALGGVVMLLTPLVSSEYDA